MDPKTLSDQRQNGRGGERANRRGANQRPEQRASPAAV
jgi:hypothetical protein